MMLLGNIFIGIGTFMALSGVIAMLLLKNFYARISISAIVDTAAFLLIIIGVIIRGSDIFFVMKAILALIIAAMVNPFSSHFIAKSARLSGYKRGKEED